MENSYKTNVGYFLMGLAVAILIFLLGKCNPTPVNPTPSLVDRTVDTFIKIDTLYVPKHIYISNNKPEVVLIDSTKKVECDTNYYNLTFVDSNYTIKTYGGFIDSLEAEVICNDKIIEKEVLVKETIRETFLEPTKGWFIDFGIGYRLNRQILPEFGFSYQFPKVRISLAVGYLSDMNVKQQNNLIVKTGVGIKIK